MPGFLPLHWDAKGGRLFLEIPALDTDLLYFTSLPYGTGSNDLGLDRGQVSGARLVRFERFGPRILLVQPNEFFRTSAKDPAEQLAVRQSFPESIIGSFAVAAENTAGASAGGGPRGRHGILPARRAWRGRCAGETRALQAGCGALRDSHRRDQGVSDEHRGGGHPDFMPRRHPSVVRLSAMSHRMRMRLPCASASPSSNCRARVHAAALRPARRIFSI